jgi:hypothetical protein
MVFASSGAAFASRQTLAPIVRLLGALCVLAALLAAPIAAEARSRSNEDLRRAIFGGFSDSELSGYVLWVPSDDIQIIDGVFLSIGGYSVRGDGRSESLFTAEVHNTTPHPFCMRVRQIMRSGPFVGRVRVDNSGINILVDARSKAAIATYTAAPAVSGQPDFRADTLAWTPNLSAPEGRKCSSVEPAEVQQMLAGEIGTWGFKFMPDLGYRLTGQTPPPPYSPGTNRASLALRDIVTRSGVSLDPTGRTMVLLDYGAATLGPIELSAASFARQGEVRAVAWLHNSSNLNICAATLTGVSLGLGGTNVRRDFAPRGGFYLPARSGRVTTSLRGDYPLEADPLRFDPVAVAWDAPPGVASDAACAALVPQEEVARALQAGSFSGIGAIGELMRR